MSDASRVQLEMRGHVAVLRMRDETHFNALSSAQVAAMLQGLSDAAARRARAIVITSDVKHFCAGADMRDMLARGTLRPSTAPRTITGPVDLFEALQREGRPVIAAVNGLAMGGGVELLLSCDLVLCTPEARFALPEVGLGVLPRTALMRLGEIVGRRRALELVLTRRKLGAEEALSFGLVNRVVETGEVLDEAVAMAAGIVQAPPRAVASVKRFMGRMPSDEWKELDSLLAQMDEREWTEGFQSFLDARTPDFEPLWQAALDEDAAAQEEKRS